MGRRALVMGYFSTVGDLEVLRQVEGRLAALDISYDVGSFSTRLSRRLPGGVNIYAVEPRDYTHLFVVCGPFDREFFVRRGVDLDRFAHCVRIGVNLTMLEKLEDYDPLDAMLGRDSDRWTQADLSFLQPVQHVPVAGLCHVRTQPEYDGAKGRLFRSSEALRNLAQRAGIAVVELDTQWPVEHNAGLLSSPEEFASVCARMDVILTTRLHGMVLALKNSVPVVAIDAVAGGGKVLAQARTIGWHEAYSLDDLDEAELDQALARCLEPAAGERARACAAAAEASLSGFADEFARALKVPAAGKPSSTRPSSTWRRMEHLGLRTARAMGIGSSAR